MNPMANRSVFDLSHDRKLSCDLGKLIPIFCQEVVPGDTFKCKTDMLIRLSPLVAPVMERISAYTHFFFVPSRLLQTNWETFITGGEAGTDSTAIPTVTSGGSGQAIGTLWDYFGLPTGVANLSVVAYPFRAYAAIYNTWYRDENVQNKVALSLGDGADTTTSMALLTRNWEKDYFTSALPWPQRGTAVSLPLGTTANIVRDSNASLWKVYNDGGNTQPSGTHTLDIYNGQLRDATTQTGLSMDPNGGLSADLTTATAASINDLREAFSLQRWMEQNARGGVRYIEQIFAHFGVKSSDARLDRPEFLGGGRSPIIVSEVIQTSSTDATTPQGNLAGHGFSAQSTHGFEKSFEEHGYIIGILSVMPRSSYFQGVERFWNRSSRLDFYWPAFAQLGEQEVLNKEVYAAHSAPTGIFGYVPRYEEYRHANSLICGDFRDEFDHWHMARKFTSDPSLDTTFLTCTPDERCFAVPAEHTLMVQMVHNVTAVRPIPKKGIPGGILG